MLLDLIKPFDWQPNGALSVGCEKYEDKTKLLFWEKNGLLHGEFILPQLNNNNFDILNLLWNKSSEILLLYTQIKSNYYLLFLVRSNYKWYIKRIVSIRDQKILNFNFSTNRLLIFYSDLVIEGFDLDLGYEISTEQSLALYCNEDFDTIDITIFSKNIIPPPMANLTIKNKGIRNSIFWTENKVICICENHIELYQILNDNKILSKNCELEKVEREKIRHLIFLTNGNLMFVFNRNSEVFLEEMKLVETESTLEIKNHNIHKIFHNIISVTKGFSDPNTVYVQYSTGAIYLFNFGKNEFAFENYMDLPIPCIKMSIVEMGGKVYE